MTHPPFKVRGKLAVLDIDIFVFVASVVIGNRTTKRSDFCDGQNALIMNPGQWTRGGGAGSQK